MLICLIEVELNIYALLISTVVMNTFQVILEVPLSREAVPGDAALASCVCAQKGLVAMSMHSMRFTLVSQETSGGRKPSAFARGHSASIRLQMRVHKFATYSCQ